MPAWRADPVPEEAGSRESCLSVIVNRDLDRAQLEVCRSYNVLFVDPQQVYTPYYRCLLVVFLWLQL
jgi:hypothetical protein